MNGLVVEHGARFLVGVPHPTATAQGFAQQASQSAAVRRALAGSRTRLLSASAEDELDKDGDRDHCVECVAVYYDYTHNGTVRVRGKVGGKAPQVELDDHSQPRPSAEEFDAAVALVLSSEAWGPLLQAGQVRPYAPMPPMLESRDGERVERTLFVGLGSKERRFNRIVAVNMIRESVSAEPVTPRTSLAIQQVCGATPTICQTPRPGTGGRITIEWPTANPVWRFEAIRPAASSGTNGSGIELRNVQYRGKRVLKQAHIPILNVQYDDDECGPYRDWLNDEWCYQAVGTDIQGAPGFRWCTQAPETIFESGEDGGNYQGVAIYEHPDGSLRLLSQLSAGWYRYIPEWRFYPDGRMMPLFRFGGVSNSCVCNVHHHHAYWRLDFDILGKVNRVQESVEGVWTPIKKETSRRRADGVPTRWRVLHAKKEIGYEIIPGEHDGVGDEFSGDDQYALLYRKGQIDDGGFRVLDAEANLQGFVNNQSILRKDVVIWYAGHYNHNAGDNDEHLTEVGPTLAPINWPGQA